MTYPKTEWLRDCRDALGEAPRRFGFWERLVYLRIPRPGLFRHDALSVFFRGRSKLLRDGFVTWGHFVQANAVLWRPDSHCAPAEVVYSPDPTRDVSPAALESAAHRLYELKGTRPTDSEAAAIARHLTAEITRAYGLPVPRAIHANPPLALSTIYVYRPHLPDDQFLRRQIVPLLVMPEDPRIVMIVPAQFWPAELASWWRGK